MMGIGSVTAEEFWGTSKLKVSWTTEFSEETFCVSSVVSVVFFLWYVCGSLLSEPTNLFDDAALCSADNWTIYSAHLRDT